MDVVKGKIDQIQTLHKKAITSTVSSERNGKKKKKKISRFLKFFIFFRIERGIK